MRSCQLVWFELSDGQRCDSPKLVGFTKGHDDIIVLRHEVFGSMFHEL
jgi:hypothetical protein